MGGGGIEHGFKFLLHWVKQLLEYEVTVRRWNIVAVEIEIGIFLRQPECLKDQGDSFFCDFELHG